MGHLGIVNSPLAFSSPFSPDIEQNHQAATRKNYTNKAIVASGLLNLKSIIKYHGQQKDVRENTKAKSKEENQEDKGGHRGIGNGQPVEERGAALEAIFRVALDLALFRPAVRSRSLLLLLFLIVEKKCHSHFGLELILFMGQFV